MTDIDIVIPVYDGLDETKQCIESVLASDIGDRAHVIVVNDCSPNAQLVDWMHEQSDLGRIELYENERNLGFVATVNKGMRLHSDRDVILLNSDTLVANDWVERLAAHASKERVSSVTPFSNNATICSFPNFCDENELLAPVGEIDAAFALVHAGKACEIPTAVGFCMYITRACIHHIGLFDEETFGRGYGEENDFCMRAVQNGWHHLIAADVFVAHVGGVSFSGEKAERVEAAQKILDRLYPDYHRSVQAFVATDPLRDIRLKAHAALIHHSSSKTVLLVSHRLGGGVEVHLRELQATLGNGGFFPVLRPGLNEGGYELSLCVGSADKLSFRLPDDYEILLSLCRFLGVGRIYFHHTMGVDPVITGLADDLHCCMDFMVHDYYLINGNPTLTDENGRFCADEGSRDALCAKHYELPFGISAEQWRVGQMSFLSRCDRVIAPSAYTASLIENYFSDVSVELAYHPDSVPEAYPEPVASKQSGPKDILVLGAISREKGADVLEAVAALAADMMPGWRFHLLGYAYRPLKHVIEHGPYSDDDVDFKIAEISPDLIWYPALWPETYSYTLSEGLRSGALIVASDIGAFSERLQGRPMSALVPWDSSPECWLQSLDALFLREKESVEDIDNLWRERYVDSPFYTGFWEQVVSPDRLVFNIDLLLENDVCHGDFTGREQWLRRLLLVRNHSSMRWVSRFVPYAIQKKVKRWFTRRPLHEIV